MPFPYQYDPTARREVLNTLNLNKKFIEDQIRHFEILNAGILRKVNVIREMGLHANSGERRSAITRKAFWESTRNVIKHFNWLLEILCTVIADVENRRTITPEQILVCHYLDSLDNDQAIDAVLNGVAERPKIGLRKKAKKDKWYLKVTYHDLTGA